MKRGLAFVLLLSLVLLSASASAQFYGYNFSLSELASNEWFNAALLFLLIFSFSWFVLNRVFATAKGAAIVASIVLGIIGAFGVVASGFSITSVSMWIVILIVIAIVLLLYMQVRRFGISLFIALVVLSALWLLLGHYQLCPPQGILPQEVCILIDTIMVVILVIGILRLLFWLINRMGGSMNLQTQWFRRGPQGPREPRQLRPQPGYHMLTVSIQGSGAIRPGPGQYRLRENQRFNIRVVSPASGWRFMHWALDGADIGRNFATSVIMNDDHHIVAVFAHVGGIVGGQQQQATRQRPARNWQALYDRFGNENQVMFNRWHHIPSRNSRNPAERADGTRYRNNIRRMRAIESEARKAGITLH